MNLLSTQLAASSDFNLYLLIKTAQRHARAPQTTHVRVAESCVAVSDSLKLLGVTLDHTMSFNKHVSTVVRTCNFHLSALRHIRSLVSDTVAQQIACSIVGSRLDYCNSLLVNCSNRNVTSCSVCRTIWPVSAATPTAQHQLDHCYGACTGCQSGSGSNSPNFVTWLLLSNSQATSLI